MIRKLVTLTGLAALAASTLLADFSYQETTTITGGALAGMMKVVGVFSKSAREPVRNTVYIKGDRMVHRSAQSMQIVDLASQTITHVDLQKKQYSVLTFDEMKQLMEQAAAEMQKNKKSDQGELKWKVSASSTGNAKQVAGFDAKEMLLKIEMEATDKESGQKGAMNMASRIWLAPNVPGYSEMRDFQKRMAEKLNWAPGSRMFMAQAEVAQGMAQAQKEIAKLEGVPVQMTMIMGGDGSGQPAPQQPQAERPSIGGALGGALGGRLGLGRKRQQDPPPAPPEGSQQAGAAASLLEMTTEYSAFSTGAVDDGQLSVPAGFKKVESDLKRK